MLVDKNINITVLRSSRFIKQKRFSERITPLLLDKHFNLSDNSCTLIKFVIIIFVTKLFKFI